MSKGSSGLSGHLQATLDIPRLTDDLRTRLQHSYKTATVYAKEGGGDITIHYYPQNNSQVVLTINSGYTHSEFQNMQAHSLKHYTKEGQPNNITNHIKVKFSLASKMFNTLAAHVLESQNLLTVTLCIHMPRSVLMCPCFMYQNQWKDKYMTVIFSGPLGRGNIPHP